MFVDTPSSIPPTEQFDQSSLWGGGITSDVVFVGGVNFFYSSVAEGQFSHPVHSSPHTSGQAEVGTSGSSMESIRTEVISAGWEGGEARNGLHTHFIPGTLPVLGTESNASFTSDPDRCHQRTHRRCGPGRTPAERKENRRWT